MANHIHNRLKCVATTWAACMMLGSLAIANDAQVDCTMFGENSEYARDICELLEQQSVKSAFATIEADHQRGLADLIELTQIPAPPFGEEKRAARFAEMLEETGFGQVTIDEVGNVIARRDGRVGGRLIAMGAHLDTVFPLETDVTVKQDGDTYKAPGIGDNTRGAVLLLQLARAIVANNLETDADILLIGNIGEEGLGDLRGVRHLFREDAERINTFIAIDGGNRNRLIYGGVGSRRYRVTFKGPGGHSWGAFGLANPHHALGRAINEFVEDAANVVKSGDKTTYNIGRIGGGTSINSVPFESWMEVDMRSGDPAKISEIDAVFKKAVERAVKLENKARTRGDALTADIKQVGDRPAGKGDLNSPLVRRSMAAMTVFGLEPDLRISSTDANIPISLGIPAVTLSRGGSTNGAHSLAETWTDDQTTLSTQIALLVLLASAQAD